MVRREEPSSSVPSSAFNWSAMKLSNEYDSRAQLLPHCALAHLLVTWLRLLRIVLVPLGAGGGGTLSPPAGTKSRGKALTPSSSSPLSTMTAGSVADHARVGGWSNNNTSGCLKRVDVAGLAEAHHPSKFPNQTCNVSAVGHAAACVATCPRFRAIIP